MKKLSLLLIILEITGFSLQSCKQNAASKIDESDAAKAQAMKKQAEENLPVITFENDTYDFGKVHEGDVVEAEFKFKNTGKGDLIITKAKASCGCTVPDWPKNQKIKPGEESVIKARFNTLHKRNNQSKTITLTTNTANGKEKVKLKGFVIPNPKYDRKTNKKSIIRPASSRPPGKVPFNKKR